MRIGDNLENWMAELPDILQYCPIIHLAIPGSHDSGSYSVTRDSPIAPDSLPFVRYLSKVFSGLVRRCVFRWSITQNLSIREQLHHGVRYLDLRVATKPNSTDLYIVHGLYGTTVNNVLSEVDRFLNEHVGEVIILDFQHFYQFLPKDHSALMNKLHQTFGDRMIPLTHPLQAVTLDYARTAGRTLIILYRDVAGAGTSTLWPASSWPTPWPETTSVTNMLQFLDSRIERRTGLCGIIVQCVLTPDIKYVLLHPFATLEKSLAAICNKAVASWLPHQRPGKNGINVVISDFVDESFCREVIKLNSKLYPDSEVKT